MISLPLTSIDERVAAVRSFNRFYTRVIGVLREGYLDTPHSLTEARVLFELARRESTEVVDLRSALRVDAGQLSRLLGRFEAGGLVSRSRSTADGRRQVIRLTDRGRAAFELLDRRSAADVRALLEPLSEEDQNRLVRSMETVRGMLQESRPPAAFLLRPPRPGDYGWVVHRHGVLYSQEYGWDESFEALVARIVADFVEHRDPKLETGWIAEVDGERAGSIFCMKKTDTVAQLRLLLVEPRARGMGIGSRLVDECVRFARRAGYKQMMLWTRDVLVEARRLYERAGFRLGEQQAPRDHGHEFVEQYWWLDL